MAFEYNEKLNLMREVGNIRVVVVVPAWDNPKKNIYGPRPGTVGTSFERRMIDEVLYHFIRFEGYEGHHIASASDVKVV